MSWTGPAAAGWSMLTDAVVSPLTTALVRLPALLAAAVLAAGPHDAGVASHQLRG